jgi:hypothetical protein
MDGAKYWVLLAVFFFQRVIAGYAARAIGEWRTKVIDTVGKPGSDLTTDEGYAILMTVMITDFLAGWVRYAITVVFLVSHFSFALAFALGDISVNLVGAYFYIEQYEVDYEGRKKPDRHRSSKQHIVAAVLQAIEMVGLFVVFWYVDFIHTDYFHFGPPVSLFGYVIRGNAAYSMIMIAAFVEQMVSAAVIEKIHPLLWSKVYNNACTTLADLGYSFSDLRFIAYVHNTTKWIRTVLVVNLALHQFIFTLVLFSGELVVFLIFAHNRVKQICEKITVNSIPCPNEKGVAIIELVEGTIIVVTFVILAIIQATEGLGLDPADETGTIPQYFDFPPPMQIFDYLITGKDDIAKIVVFAAVGRALTTMANEITKPYTQNVIVGEDMEDVHYDWAHAYFIVIVDLITSWFNRLVSLHFVLSNILLACVLAAVDIVFNALILERYLLYKARCQREELDTADDARIREFREFVQKTKEAETQGQTTKPTPARLAPVDAAVTRRRHQRDNLLKDFLYPTDNFPWTARARQARDLLDDRGHPGGL